MTLFYVLYAINVIAALVVLYFFFIGLADGSVSSFNGKIWFYLLAVVAALLIGTLLLKSAGKLSLANGFLAVGAIPAIVAGVFFLAILIFKPKWN